MSDSKIILNEVKRSAREEANVSGRWSADEHRLFLRGLEMHGKDYKKIAALVKTRNVTQVKAHARKKAGPLDPFYQARNKRHTRIIHVKLSPISTVNSLTRKHLQLSSQLFAH